MQEEIAEFEIGKRHLANIMGQDPDMFQQEDIDVCYFQMNIGCVLAARPKVGNEKLDFSHALKRLRSCF